MSSAAGTSVTSRLRLRLELSRVLAAGAVPALAMLGAGCGGAGNTPRPAAESAAAAVPAELADGERLFDANCARCHGPRGTGTQQGPPLVHRVYEPSHHGDAAFQLAAAQGVVAHHWRFGAMPPVPNVTPDQVERIVAYVRWLQREAGIGG